MDNKDKQNKKFPCVNTNRFRSVNQAPFFGECENIFNSTAKNPSDLISTDADISTISLFYTGNETKFGSEFGTHKSSHSNEIIANSNDINTKQMELDCLYVQYLTLMTMKETLKKSFKDEEENFIKDMFELHKCSETLKKACAELDYEKNVITSLADLVKFMDTTIEWIDSNTNQLNNFQENILKLSELCSKANKYLKIENIHMPDDVDFEETVVAELRQTSMILQQINNLCDERCLTPAPEIQSDGDFDYKLIKDLKQQYDKLKICLLKYNTLRVMSKQ